MKYVWFVWPSPAWPSAIVSLECLLASFSPHFSATTICCSIGTVFGIRFLLTTSQMFRLAKGYYTFSLCIIRYLVCNVRYEPLNRCDLGCRSCSVHVGVKTRPNSWSKFDGILCERVNDFNELLHMNLSRLAYAISQLSRYIPPLQQTKVPQHPLSNEMFEIDLNTVKCRFKFDTDAERLFDRPGFAAYGARST